MLVGNPEFPLAVMARSEWLAAIVGFAVLSLPFVIPILLIAGLVFSEWRAGRRKLALGTPPHPYRRLSLKMKLIVGGSLALLLIALIAAWWHQLPQDNYTLLTGGFASNPRLQDVSVEGFNRSPLSLGSDFHAMNASVHIKGRAGAELVFDHPAPDLFTGAAHVRLLRLGPHIFSNPGPDVGPEGDLAALLPFRVASVDDVIDHYDELSALFDDLPARRLAHAEELVNRANQPQTQPSN